MLEAVTTAISTVVSWVGTVVTALVGTEGALAELLPLFAVGRFMPSNVKLPL